MRRDIPQRQKEILSWINQGQSKAYICRQLRCRPLTLDNWLHKMGIQYQGNQSGKGIRIDPKRLSAVELAKKHWVQSSKLRLRLIEDEIREHRCEECKRETWNNKPIPLELHHIDGDRWNNKLDNLKIICPNCHSQTSNNSKKK